MTHAWYKGETHVGNGTQELVGPLSLCIVNMCISIALHLLVCFCRGAKLEQACFFITGNIVGCEREPLLPPLAEFPRLCIPTVYPVKSLLVSLVWLPFLPVLTSILERK